MEACTPQPNRPTAQLPLPRPQVQRQTMADFRAGRLNMLIATHVGAEGLDFGCCGLVVQLDTPDSVVDYLQCRCV